MRAPLVLRDHSYGELASILENPNKLAAVKNSYHSFKKHGGINLPQFLHKRQSKANDIDKTLRQVSNEVYAKIEEEKQAERMKR